MARPWQDWYEAQVAYHLPRLVQRILIDYGEMPTILHEGRRCCQYCGCLLVPSDSWCPGCKAQLTKEE